MRPLPSQPLCSLTSRPTGLPSWVMALAGTLVFGSLLLEHGYTVPASWLPMLQGLNVSLSAVYVLNLVLMLACHPRKREVLRQRRYEGAVLAAFLIAVLALLAWPQFMQAPIRLLHVSRTVVLILDLLQLYLLANLLVQLARLQERILTRGYRPEVVLVGSFAMLVTAGTLLLLLPRASAHPESPLHVLDALFTSTSASCVTGLTVRDTGADFSVLGQAIVMGLFQLGGLGIMTFVAFLAFTGGESLPIRNLVAFKEMLSARSIAGLKRQVSLIVLATLLVEAVGAACLYACLPPQGDPLARLGWSAFHSVSAFCNAGFGLDANSLIPHQANIPMMLTFMTLIILGGLGFLVLSDLAGVQVSRLPLLQRISWIHRFNQRYPVRRLPLQTRLSLLVTAALICLGLALFWILEAGHSLGGQPVALQATIAAFQSVTTRTAGFNSTSIDQLQPATLVLLMALMVVGACPVSTGGGIKTVTFAVLLLVLRSLITGRERVEVGGRALPPKVLLAAFSVFVLYILATAVGLFGLSACNPQIPLRDLAFEIVSALSTVGLSTGITAQLSAGSKLILCAAMFIGRVGPIALVLSIFQAKRRAYYQYPEENLVVG